MLGDSYSRGERLLHRVALGSQFVRWMSFELERALYGGNSRRTSAGCALRSVEEGAPVFVCGLARSGTTVLLRLLDEVPGFVSLSYRDMPFPLAPGIWRRLSRYWFREEVAIERAHGDGIIVGYDSPEAFEEVFWKTIGLWLDLSSSFRGESEMVEALGMFRDYRAAVLSSRAQCESGREIGRRYLSKNNNNVTRLDLLERCPGATVLIAYRNPFATAASLHRQHLHFCDAQRRDPFVRAYMGWLGHHEFGLDHKPYSFCVPYMEASLDPASMDYWLDYWVVVHQHILRRGHKSEAWVRHETLRQRPVEMIDAIVRRLGVRADTGKLASQIRSIPEGIVDGFDKQIRYRAQEAYELMVRDSRNLL